MGERGRWIDPKLEAEVEATRQKPRLRPRSETGPRSEKGEVRHGIWDIGHD